MSIVKFNGGDAVMSTVDLRELINDARLLAGEAKVRNDQFLSRVEDELGDELEGVQKYYTPIHGNQVATYDLTRDQCMLVSMRESKAVRRNVVAKLNGLDATPQPRLPENLPDALRFAADLAEEKAALALENQQQAAKIESLENFFMAGETPFQFVKRLNGVNCSLISHSLMEMGWVFNDADPKSRPHYRVYSATRAKKWLNEKPRTIRGEGESTFVRYDLVLLLDGAKKLHDLYMMQKLPMKKTWDGRFSYTKFTSEASL